jgi:hypothetical protein
MKRLWTLSLLLAGASIPANATVTVEAASGDWSKLPKLSQRGYEHLNEKMQAKLYEIADSRHCPAFALNQGRLDLNVSFAVQYAPDGSLTKLVLPKLDCAEAEGVLGGALLEMLQSGDYASTGKSEGGWYQGALGFSFAGDKARNPGVSPPTVPQAAAKAKDPNEIVCEKAEVIGTRLRSTRTCMSRAQWAEQKRLTRQMIEQVQTQRPCTQTDEGVSC